MYCDHVALIDTVCSLAAILKAGESLGRLYTPAVETPSKRLFPTPDTAEIIDSTDRDRFAL